MRKKKKTALAGIVLVGVAFLAWKQSKKQRAKFVNWKKQKVENMYYNNIDERDIAYG